MPEETQTRNSVIYQWVMLNTIQIENTIERLRMTRRIIKVLDDNLSQQLKAGEMLNFIEKLLNTEKFVKKVRHRFSVTAEPGDAEQYYDEKISEDEFDKYNYDSKLENHILEIDLKIDEFMSMVVKNLEMEEGIDLSRLLTKG